MEKTPYNMPKLSFVVTSYNYADYIGECIESILTQTYLNIEIIVVDDHSNDGSVRIIRDIIEKNKTGVKIKLIAHESNKGQLASIFDGIWATSGEFIACIDSDDKILPDYAMTHISLHLTKACALTVCEQLEIDENSTLLSVNSPFQPEIEGIDIKTIKAFYKGIEQEYNIKILDRKKQFFGGWWWAPTSCGVFRKASIMPFLTFHRPNNWRTSPDKLLFNLLHLTGGSIKLYKPLVMYRRHGKNAGVCNTIMGDTRYNTNSARKKYLENQINLYKDVLDFFKSNKKTLEETYSTKYYKKMLNEIYYSIPKLLIYKLTH